MSNRRRRRRLTPGELAHARAEVIASAKANGCTCEPDVRYPRHPHMGDAIRVDILHDDDCPLLDRGWIGEVTVIREGDARG